ncbi:MAG: hypothetical protein JNK05_02195 [Myxococcales bacterium]|nr:hypothetical protein [Myxococcales bacterium]
MSNTVLAYVREPLAPPLELAAFSLRAIATNARVLVDGGGAPVHVSMLRREIEETAWLARRFDATVAPSNDTIADDWLGAPTPLRFGQPLRVEREGRRSVSLARRIDVLVREARTIGDPRRVVERHRRFARDALIVVARLARGERDVGGWNAIVIDRRTEALVNEWTARRPASLRVPPQLSLALRAA